MKALQFTDSIPRYALTKVLGTGKPDAFWSRAACLQLKDVDPPRLPGPDWVRVRTRYGGICGSDLGTITLHASTSTSVFTSFPFTLGHENVGFVSEVGPDAGDVAAGDRVVVNPLLPCATRGFADPCEMCARGAFNLCQRFDRGALSAGLMTGFCRDTGGSWSSEFVAHRSQLLRVPSSLSDEEAVLAEPFAVALHAVLRCPPPAGCEVLVVGGGIIGLCVVAALRALGSETRVVVSTRHQFQADAARRLGADEALTVAGKAMERQLVGAFDAEALKPVLGRNVVVGGADVVYECVGASASLGDALRFTSSGGTLVLVGLAGAPRSVDWTPIWLNELTLLGSFCYGTELLNGETIATMELALRLMAEGRAHLGSLVTHRFDIEDYRHALGTVTSKGSSNVIKGVFTFE